MPSSVTVIGAQCSAVSQLKSFYDYFLLLPFFWGGWGGGERERERERVRERVRERERERECVLREKERVRERERHVLKQHIKYSLKNIFKKGTFLLLKLIKDLKIIILTFISCIGKIFKSFNLKFHLRLNWDRFDFKFFFGINYD